MELRVSAVVEEALRAAADAFHKIVADLSVRRLLAREGHKMPQLMHDSLVGKMLDPAEVVKIAADGFELCVRALAATGASDVTIHECSEHDMEGHW
jgi:hypothetical protein